MCKTIVIDSTVPYQHRILFTLFKYNPRHFSELDLTVSVNETKFDSSKDVFDVSIVFIIRILINSIFAKAVFVALQKTLIILFSLLWVIHKKVEVRIAIFKNPISPRSFNNIVIYFGN